MGRSRKRILIIGTTNTGKSTLVKKLIEVYKKQNAPVIILDPNRQKAYFDFPEIDFEKLKLQTRGVYRIISSEFILFFKTVFENFKHGLIVGEESDQYLKAQKNEELFKNLLALRHPEQDNDIVLISHSIMDTADYVIRNCNEIILLKTGDNWSKVKDKFPSSKQREAFEKFNMVNAHESLHHWERIIIIKSGTK